MLSTFPRPTAALDTRIIVPVNVGLTRGASKANAVAVAVEMVSERLSCYLRFQDRQLL